MSSQMEKDNRNLRVELWDLGAVDGPVKVEMWSVDARDALARAGARYVTKLPRGVKAGPAQEEAERRKREEMDDLAGIRAADPVFGGLTA